MSNPNRMPWRWITVALMLAVAVATFRLFNSSYGETSHSGYQYAKAVFRACNQRDEAKLQQIAEMVGDSREAGDIGPAEAGWLSTIIDEGLAGNWERASREVRQLMEDQIQAAPALPQP